MVRSIEKVVASSPDLKRARLAALSNLVKSKKSGHLEKYYQLLTDFNFLAEKINHPEFGVQALIEDYDLVDDPPQPPLKSYALVASFLTKEDLTGVIEVGETSFQV